MTLPDPPRLHQMPSRLRLAIVFADLVESVRLMQQHEAETIARWRQFVARVHDVTLPALGARMVRKAGDALLIEADSAARAVRTAFALHETLAPLNDGHPEDARMRLRIGIHVAEVVVERDDLQGSGTNLAARLATLGQPGDTLLSAEARAEMTDGLQARFEDLGAFHVDQLGETTQLLAGLDIDLDALQDDIPFLGHDQF